jgi:beta-lactamase class C
MWTPVTVLPKGRGYALGWGVFSYRGRQAIAHSGDQQGASATILLIPERRVGVAILANTENADADALAHSIVDVVIDR